MEKKEADLFHFSFVESTTLPKQDSQRFVIRFTFIRSISFINSHYFARLNVKNEIESHIFHEDMKLYLKTKRHYSNGS